MNKKLNNKAKYEILLNKISILKKLFNIYEENITKTIKELSDMYLNYRDESTKKLREETKINKKEIKREKPNQFIEEFKLVRKYYEYIKNTGISGSYFLIFLLIFIICLVLYFIIGAIWESYFTLDRNVFNVVNNYGQLASLTLKIANSYLLMIYNNRTLTDLSSFIEPTNPNRDYIAYIFTKFEIVYEIDKYFSLTKGVYNPPSTYIPDNCSNFINNIQSVPFQGLIKIFGKKLLTDSLIIICEDSYLLKFINLKEIYAKLYNQIKNGINKIHDFSYQGIVQSLNELYLPKLTLSYLSVYNYLFEIIAKNVQSMSTVKITQIMGNFITATVALYLGIELLLIIIIFFLFVRNIDIDCKKLFQLQKVFKVCNYYQ